MRVTEEQLQTIFELATELHLSGKLSACNMTTADASRTPIEAIDISITTPSGQVSRWIIEGNGDAAPVTKGRKTHEGTNNII